MLSLWLVCNNRNPCEYDRFQVIDGTEIAQNSDQVKSHLVQLALRSKFDPKFLESAAQYLGWAKLRNIVESKKPLQEKVRRGQFGEILAAALLEEFYGYTIPVYKFRFALTSDQSLPSTDTIGLKVNHGEVE